jgi:hypothetical protein
MIFGEKSIYPENWRCMDDKVSSYSQEIILNSSKTMIFQQKTGFGTISVWQESKLHNLSVFSAVGQKISKERNQ